MILNLTQHAGTPEQNVQDLKGEDLLELKRLLTFDSLPGAREVKERAKAIAAFAARQEVPPDFCMDFREGVEECPERCWCKKTYADCIYACAMIGGAPYLMAPLEKALGVQGIDPLYSFSERVSAEEIQPDGSVKKVAIFRHKGWV